MTLLSRSYRGDNLKEDHGRLERILLPSGDGPPRVRCLCYIHGSRVDLSDLEPKAESVALFGNASFKAFSSEYHRSPALLGGGDANQHCGA